MGVRGEATKQDAKRFLKETVRGWRVDWQAFFDYQNEYYSEGSWKEAVVKDFWLLLLDYGVLDREPHGHYVVLTANGQFKRPHIFLASSLYFSSLREARGYAKAFCARGARVFRLQAESRT